MSYYGLVSKYGLILFEKVFGIKKLPVILGFESAKDVCYLLPLGFDFSLLEALFYYKQPQQEKSKKRVSVLPESPV